MFHVKHCERRGDGVLHKCNPCCSFHDGLDKADFKHRLDSYG